MKAFIGTVAVDAAMTDRETTVFELVGGQSDSSKVSGDATSMFVQGVAPGPEHLNLGIIKFHSSMTFI
jgi:hypothetical protein